MVRTETMSRGEEVVTLVNLLRQKRLLLAALSGTLTYFNYSYMEPILAIRLRDFDLT
jgi:hypothetical protein